MCRLYSIFVEIWTLRLKLKHQLAMNFLVNDFCIKWIRTLNCGGLDSSNVSLLLIMYAFNGTMLLLLLISHLRGLACPHGLSPLPDLSRCEEICPNCLLHEVFTGSSIWEWVRGHLVLIWPEDCFHNLRLIIMIEEFPNRILGLLLGQVCGAESVKSLRNCYGGSFLP
jgi:hypothetical protein